MRAFAMIAGLVLCLAGSGCYTPTFEGIRCGARGECPNGFECRDDRCAALGSPDGPDSGDDGALPPDSAGVDAPGDPADAAVDATPKPPDAKACPSDYMAVDGQSSSYRLVTSADDWLAAERGCEDDGAATGGGTHLLVLDNAAELAALDPRIPAAVWVGMVDRVDEGALVLVTGAVPVFRPFRANEPNDGGPFGPTEDCVELNGPELNDEDCGTNRQYVCECDGIDADPEAYTPDDDDVPPLAPR